MCELNIRARSSRPLSLRRCIDQLRIVRRIAVSAFVLAAGLNETPMPPTLLLTILGLNVSPRPVGARVGFVSRRSGAELHSLCARASGDDAGGARRHLSARRPLGSDPLPRRAADGSEDRRSVGRRTLVRRHGRVRAGGGVPAARAPLALIDPIGFWRDTDPIVNWVKLSPAELPNYIFRNPTVEAAQQMF